MYKVGADISDLKSIFALIGQHLFLHSEEL